MSGQVLSFKIASPEIASERLDGEVILVSLESGKYFNFNGTASDVFWMIERGVPREKWEELLSRYFNNSDSMTHDINVLVSKLLTSRIITQSSADPITLTSNEYELPNDYKRDKWISPELTEFSDLKDLILVDPVHDTSLEGWPIENA